jgi:hypothetical protein
VDGRSPFRHTSNRSLEREAAHRSKWRLLGLLVLFDVLLIVAVLLSFQSTELVEEEVILRQTREVYDVQIREQVVTHTTVITQVIPYGSTP